MKPLGKELKWVMPQETPDGHRAWGKGPREEGPSLKGPTKPLKGAYSDQNQRKGKLIQQIRLVPKIGPIPENRTDSVTLWITSPWTMAHGISHMGDCIKGQDNCHLTCLRRNLCV